jgi:hypothetical protein
MALRPLRPSTDCDIRHLDLAQHSAIVVTATIYLLLPFLHDPAGRVPCATSSETYLSEEGAGPGNSYLTGMKMQCGFPRFPTGNVQLDQDVLQFVISCKAKWLCHRWMVLAAPPRPL